VLATVFLYAYLMKNHLAATCRALKELLSAEGGPEGLHTPRGYRHMGLIILDAVFSLQANYDAIVVPLLQRYCEAEPNLLWSTKDSDAGPEHTAQDLLDFLASLDGENRLSLLNRQITPGTARSRSGPVLKADAVIRIAETLVSQGISTRDEFRHAVESDIEKSVGSVEQAVCAVPGIGIACWRYLLNLSGAQAVKPDTMILRWLEKTLGERPFPKAAARLIEDATAQLQDEGMDVTVRQMDHLIWRTESGRARPA